MNDKITKLQEYIDESNYIVFFGGAGVSTESNIPDFRSADGLFNQKLNVKFTPEQLVSHSMYVKYPDIFFDFYKNNLIFKDAKPNKAHISLTKLEEKGKLKAIITQNIDGLHKFAGSKKVYELHGSVNSNTCTNCGKNYNLEEFLKLEGAIPKCKLCGSVVKPDVVLYEESLDDNVIRKSVEAIKNADLLIIGGTSLVVYPAAGLLQYFRGKHLVLINKSTTSMDSSADLIINDKIGEVLSLIK